jgi:Predicted RNA polymerase sigma factor containing a TPR repeat domain
MTANADEQIRKTLDAIYASESCRILATLIRLLGDFDLAEDALHDAFRAALERWSKQGVPATKLFVVVKIHAVMRTFHVA